MKSGGPVERWNWARNFVNEEMSATARAVLVELACMADKDGACWPSQSRLAEQTLFSERTIRTALATLSHVGAIRIEKPHGGRGGNIYRLSGADARWESIRQDVPPSPQSIRQGMPVSTESIRQDVPPSTENRQDVPDSTQSNRQDVPPFTENRQDMPDYSIADENKPANPAKQTGSSRQTNRQELPPEPLRRREPSIEPGKRGRSKPKVSEEFIGEMEKVFVNAKFDVREEIARALSHKAAQKYDPPDLYIKSWLRREANPTWGRPGGATRAEPVTDHHKDFFGGNDESN